MELAPLRRQRLLTKRNQVVEPEDEPEDTELDGAGAGDDDDLSAVEPDSLLAWAFSDALLGLSLVSLGWPSLGFSWLGSFNLFE